MKYEKMIQSILKEVGGQENIEKYITVQQDCVFS